MLEGAGHEAWCVGGALRDTLLGDPHSDFDLATSARPEEVQRLFRRTAADRGGARHRGRDRPQAGHARGDHLPPRRRDRRPPRGGRVRRLARRRPRPPRLHHQRHRLPSAARRVAGSARRRARSRGRGGARGRRSGGAVPGGLPPHPPGASASPRGSASRSIPRPGRPRARPPAVSAGCRRSGCGTSGSRACARRASWGRWCGSGTSRVRRRSGCPSCGGRTRAGSRRAELSPPPRDPVLLTALLASDPAGLLRRLRASNAEIARAEAMAAGPAEPGGSGRGRGAALAGRGRRRGRRPRRAASAAARGASRPG